MTDEGLGLRDGAGLELDDARSSMLPAICIKCLSNEAPRRFLAAAEDDDRAGLALPVCATCWRARRLFQWALSLGTAAVLMAPVFLFGPTRHVVLGLALVAGGLGMCALTAATFERGFLFIRGVGGGSSWHRVRGAHREWVAVVRAANRPNIP